MDRVSKILILIIVPILIAMITLTIVLVIELVTQPLSKEGIQCLILLSLAWLGVQIWLEDIIEGKKIPA
jgi:hypothetical protein